MGWPPRDTKKTQNHIIDNNSAICHHKMLFSKANYIYIYIYIPVAAQKIALAWKFALGGGYFCVLGEKMH